MSPCSPCSERPPPSLAFAASSPNNDRPMSRRFVTSVLLVLSLSACAKEEPNVGPGMYSIEFVSGTVQAVDAKQSPTGKSTDIDGKQNGTTACHFDTAPPKETETWFLSSVDPDGKIRQTLDYGPPKEVSSCAVGVLANLGVKFGAPGEYKFTAKVKLSKSKM